MGTSDSDAHSKRRQIGPFRIPFQHNHLCVPKHGEYASISIRGGYETGKAGEPAIPWRRFYIYLPSDPGGLQLEVKTGQPVTIEKDITVVARQREVPTMDGTQVRWVPPDESVYSSKEFWPEVGHQLGSIRRTGRFSLAEILMCHFRYYFKERKLDLYPDIEVSLWHDEQLPQMAAYSVTGRQDKVFRERVARLVLNGDDLLERSVTVDSSVQSRGQLPVRHVIITPEKLAGAFRRLVAWRTLLGVRSRVVTVEDMLNNRVPFSNNFEFWKEEGYSEHGTRDCQEAVRTFIKWASENWRTDYVLIGGDTGEVPVRKALHSRAGTVQYHDIQKPDRENPLQDRASASSEQPECPADNVLSQDPSELWKSEKGDTDPWLQVTLTGRRAINHVQVVWGSRPATEYSIEISTDEDVKGMKGNWTTLLKNAQGLGAEENISLQCAMARYLRLSMAGAGPVELASLRVFGPQRTEWDGAAYMTPNGRTRIYVGTKVILKRNTSNDPNKSQLLVKDGGQLAGHTIKFSEDTDPDEEICWRFASDLVGGEMVPYETEYVEILSNAPLEDMQFILKYDENYIPTDLYYADIAPLACPVCMRPGCTDHRHDWDWSGNSVYGQRHAGEIDGVNGIPDVAIGRAPVSTEEDVLAFVNKVINYERYTWPRDFQYVGSQPDDAAVDEDPLKDDVTVKGKLLADDFAVSVLLGSQNWFEKTEAGLDLSAFGKEKIRQLLLTDDPSRWIIARRYEDRPLIAEAGTDPNLMDADSENIYHAIRGGTNMVSLSSHGSPNHICGIRKEDISRMVNPPGVFYGNACLSNAFDTPAYDAFAEQALLNPSGGAVAFVGNTRFGWTQDNPNEEAFWEEMLESGRLGEMFRACIMRQPGWSSYSLNLLGDPAMRVWTNVPTRPLISCPRRIPAGKKTKLNVTVSTAGKGDPVAAASLFATLKQVVNGAVSYEILRTGVTDGNGQATLELDVAASSKIELSVSGRNLIPDFRSIDVVDN